MDIEELNTVPESEFSVGNFAKEAKNAKDLIDLLIERNMKITESQKEEAVEFCHWLIIIKFLVIGLNFKING